MAGSTATFLPSMEGSRFQASVKNLRQSSTSTISHGDESVYLGLEHLMICIVARETKSRQMDNELKAKPPLRPSVYALSYTLMASREV